MERSKSFIASLREALLSRLYSGHVICVRTPEGRGAPIPKRKVHGDAGFDLYCAETVTIQPGEEAKISLGICVKVPHGSVGIILPRSSANGMKLHVRTGVIDSGYTGPLYALVLNQSEVPVEVAKGSRICQILPLSVFPVSDSMLQVMEMPETQRGTRGFGSTGDTARHV